jgi:hypothetical protein
LSFLDLLYKLVLRKDKYNGMDQDNVDINNAHCRLNRLITICTGI